MPATSEPYRALSSSHLSPLSSPLPTLPLRMPTVSGQIKGAQALGHHGNWDGREERREGRLQGLTLTVQFGEQGRKKFPLL